MIELHELQKSYGSVKALNGLSLSVPKGSLYGLLGPNGAGKTTAIRILCTLLSPDSGQVKVAGIDALNDPRAVRNILGYVGQEIAIDKILTGRELLKLQGDLYHIEAAQIDLRIQGLIERLGMKDWIDRRCGTYSGGMRRRLDLASGLLHQPKLLILDEPTVGLDLESRGVIWRILRELTSIGTTVLLSSHYLEEIEALSDYMSIIDQGRVIAEGTIEQLKGNLGGDRVKLRVREFSDAIEAEKVKKVLGQVQGVCEVVVNPDQGFSLNLVVENDEALGLIREHLKIANFPIFSLSQSRPSLDDVYLQATGRTLMDVELEVSGQRDMKLEKKQSMR